MVSRATNGSNPKVTTAILEAVSEATDTPITELPPLGDVVDPEAMNQFFTIPGGDPAGLVLAFEYAGVRVTVRDGTAVATRPVEEPSA